MHLNLHLPLAQTYTLPEKRDAASIVKEATETTPKRAQKIKKRLIEHGQKKTRTFSSEEGLAMILDLK